MEKVNIGCGKSPTPGWVNFDNSMSVRLQGFLPLARLMSRVGLLNPSQMAFIQYCHDNDIRWANAVEHIPARDGALDVVYSSHMLEHLDAAQARAFLNEARRVLRSGGTIRLAVPSIRFHVDNYLASGDADAFVQATGLARPAAPSMLKRAKAIFIGDRGHKWMYDGRSLCRLLEQAGFSHAAEMPAGDTSIPEPGALNLSERAPESVFVEAKRP